MTTPSTATPSTASSSATHPAAVRQRRERVLLSGLLLVLALMLFGAGASAMFTASTAGTTSVASGTVVLDLGADGTAANRLSMDATNIAPGDIVERAVDVINSGTLDLSQLTLTTSASRSSLLDTDTADGLQMTVRGCSIPWTERSVENGAAYSCAGATSTLVSARPVIGTDMDLSATAAITAGETAHLAIELVLPETAGNEFQGQTTTEDYVFDAVQRTAERR